MSNEILKPALAGDILSVLLAEPPAAMVALALRHLPEDPDLARRLAALGCALQCATFDVGTDQRDRQPAAVAAAELEKWLRRRGGDKALRILSLHFASLLLADTEAGPDAACDAADWLHEWFANGKTRRPLMGYS